MRALLVVWMLGIGLLCAKAADGDRGVLIFLALACLVFVQSLMGREEK